METLFHDLRYAVRTWRRTPGFSIVAIATIALGISATTTVFSLIAALLLNPLPVPDPDRLVVVDEIHRGGTHRMMGAAAFSFTRYEAYRDASSEVFTGLAGHRLTEASLRVEDAPEVVNTVAATANYFDVLALVPAEGRFFAPDASRASPRPAIISHEAWRTRFGGAPDAIGRRVFINSTPHEIVGVAPRGFSGTVVGLPTDIWIPADAGDGTPLTLFGRLRDGLTPASAAAALDVISRQVPLDYPNSTIVSAATQPLTPIPAFARGPAIGFMGMLLATAGLVLLIASTNVAGVLLARASERRREVAVRMALGAGRLRVVRQFVVESVVLFLAGGAAGVLLTAWFVALVAAFEPPVPARIALDFGVDLRVLAFACGVTLLAGLLAGLAPALQTSRAAVLPGLREGTAGGGRRTRLRGAFVVAQLALSLLLVVVAGLFARTLQHALASDVGFNADGVVVAGVNPDAHGYDSQQAQRLQSDLLERVRAVPGVEAAAFAVWAPMGGYVWTMQVSADGEPARPMNANIATIGSGYVETLQVPLVAGRTFSTSDQPGTPLVALVNQTLARQLFDEAAPLGRVIVMGEERAEVVGILADGKYENYTEAQAAVLYLSLDQRLASAATLHVRSRVEAALTLAAVRRELAAIDPNIALEQAMPLSRLIGLSLYPQRMAALAIGAFGVTGLLLAALGLYGLLTFHVSSRTQEIGIRLALGAPLAGVIRLVLRQSLRLALIGTALGLAAAFALTRLLEGLLFGVKPLDLVTFAGASLLLLVIAMLASYLPARRATRVDPTVALRAE
jgi:putative ABC transport system permease protein